MLRTALRTLKTFNKITLSNTTIVKQIPRRLQYCTSVNPPAVPLAKLDKKMQIVYTCKVCNHRNSQTISNKAYTEGVVLVRCSGCDNNHLVADNLGWFRDKKTNIEDLMKEKGEIVQKN